MAEISEKNAGQWQNWVKDFDKTYGFFKANYAGLVAQGPYVESRHPELLNEYNRLVVEGQEHYNTMAKLAVIRDKVVGWIKKYQELQPPLEPWSGSLLYGLSAIPIAVVGISIASASAAIFAVAKYVKETYVFAKILEEAKRLEAEGYSPREASEIARSASKSAMRSFFGVDLKWIILAGVLIFIGPPFIRLLTKKGVSHG